MSDKKKKMYVVNNNDEHNPGGHHEMHTIDHAQQLRIESYTELGYFENVLDALKKARSIYPDADGCAICCPLADSDRNHKLH